MKSGYYIKNVLINSGIKWNKIIKSIRVQMEHLA
jgi:hypothetical protein